MTPRILLRRSLACLIVVAAVGDASAQTPSPATSSAPLIATRPDGSLDVSAPPAGAVMRYTLDGTDPTRDAGEWLAPVRVPPGYTVRVRPVAADGTPVGEVATWSAPPAGARTPSTLVPVTQNRDWRVYDWTTRHREASALMRTRRPDIVMLGDSITHFWGGEPVGGRRTGVEEWDRFFAGRSVVNLGYGWDRTENVLWRLEHGEFEGVTPRVVVLMVGTNNITLNTPDEIAAGVEAICASIHQRSPATKILLLAIFPRGQKPDATRAKVDDVNRLVAKLDTRDYVTFLDIGAKFLEPDGSISPDVMYDYLHPTPKGYAIWSAAMAPTLDGLAAAPKAFIDGTGPGWRTLGPNDFARVNDYPDTWTWDGDVLESTGVPIGVMRTRDEFRNFELVVEWRHLKSAGNSGVFAWVPMKALDGLPPDQLPKWGIEVQMLDHGYRQWFRERSPGKPDDWFTTNGDIFAVGDSTLETFEPRSPDGSRSFPRKALSRGVGEWNHYYVRGINGEIRLWVNGEEVSGGRGAEPRTGFLCLEAEGSPVEFRNLRVRELP